MPFDPKTPYNELPNLPPGVDLESKSVLKLAIAANKALAELKGAGELVPNQAVLIQSIGLQEAKLSSEIENIVTTNDELYRAFANKGEKANPHTKEVLSYNDALWHGFDAIKNQKRPLTTNLFEELFHPIQQFFYLFEQLLYSIQLFDFLNHLLSKVLVESVRHFADIIVRVS